VKEKSYQKSSGLESGAGGRMECFCVTATRTRGNGIDKQRNGNGLMEAQRKATFFVYVNIHRNKFQV
jgi:hypothetical protein